MSLLRNHDDRLRLWQRYLRLQVHQVICRTWVKLMVVPSMATVTGAIIICFYVTIRNQDMPPWLPTLFFYVGINLFSFVFWVAFQAHLIVRTSEAIIGVLTSMEDELLGDNDVPPNVRKYIALRGKATRPLNFSIGAFNEFSLDVPIGIWDEILNQLLFLLTF